jgi:hypothetical protein
VTLLFAGTLSGVLGVSAIARRGRVAAAVVSYSLPRLVTTIEGAAVAVDLVDFTTTGGAFVLAFFGGMKAAFDIVVARVAIDEMSRREAGAGARSGAFAR